MFATERESCRMPDKDALRVHLFIARNKDNRHIDGFKQRKIAFIEYDSNRNKIDNKFYEFVNAGFVDGELCRHYMSVNARDSEKVRQAVMHRLIDKADVRDLNRIVVSEAMKSICSIENKWLFDFDSNDTGELLAFLDNLRRCRPGNIIKTTSTPHGFAIVAKYGFDVRKIDERWNDTVELKRDGMLLIDWRIHSIES